MKQELSTGARNLRRPNQFLREYPQFTHGGLRDQIFKSKQNGLETAGAVIRVISPGAKRGVVWIDVDKYFAWMTSGQRSAA